MTDEERKERELTRVERAARLEALLDGVHALLVEVRESFRSWNMDEEETDGGPHE